MLKTLGIVVLVLVLGVLAVAASRPDTFRVERATTIKAPPEKVFALINDFRAWVQWSPWERMDPSMKRVYSGAASGPGAVYAWDGDKKVGQGQMEITAAVPAERVAVKLDFARPFEAHNTAEFALRRQGDSVTVTWTMQGPNPFIGKVMSVFVSMDSIVGKDFESGLANLKAVAEK